MLARNTLRQVLAWEQMANAALACGEQSCLHIGNSSQINHTRSHLIRVPTIRCADHGIAQADIDRAFLLGKDFFDLPKVVPSFCLHT